LQPEAFVALVRTVPECRARPWHDIPAPHGRFLDKLPSIAGLAGHGAMSFWEKTL